MPKKQRIRDLERQVSFLVARCEQLRRLEIDPLNQHPHSQHLAVTEERLYLRLRGIDLSDDRLPSLSPEDPGLDPSPTGGPESG